MSAGSTPDAAGRVAGWLLLCAALVLLVLLAGGITRLTQSGLSIVRWQPLTGVVPPLSEEAWDAAFAQYRQSPQYRLVNVGMSLEQFRSIYWWEYGHRLLARVAGLVFVLPMFCFVLAGRIRGRLLARLLTILALGVLQGFLGWYMVASGLIDDPRVSPFRLAAHLGLALAIAALLLWNSWSLRLGAPRTAPPPVAIASLAVLGLMALSGALVAGTHGGLVYNTFPSMGGRWLPPEVWSLRPWYLNLRDNPVTTQFLHRVLAVLVAGFSLALAASCWHSAGPGRRASRLLVAALGLQLGLGVATLLSAAALPLAAAHQAGAVLLFAAVLWAVFALAQESRATL